MFLQQRLKNWIFSYVCKLNKKQQYIPSYDKGKEVIPIDKKELIKHCSAETGYTQKTVADIYDSIWNTYKQEILSGQPLTISGFGNIQVVSRKSKNHKHPVTGEHIQGKEYKTLHLSPTPSFMEQINNVSVQPVK